jgi:hypothetical protein
MRNSEQMDFESVLLGIANQFKANFGGSIPKTKLLKLAYLVELEYQRRHKSRLTEQNWVYYLYGPYVYDYDQYITYPNFERSETNSDFEGEKQAEFIEPLRETISTLDSSVRSVVSSIVQQYGRYPLSELLEYVYFETEPMMNVETRGETLDFGTALDSEYYRVRELRIEKKTEETLRKSFRDKLEQIRAKRNS